MRIELSVLIGTVAASLTTLSFVPQAVRTFRTRDVGGISLWAYVMFCTGVALWVLYGIYLASLPVIVANVVTLALALGILGMRVRFALRARPRAGRPDVAL
jgi:MtN3 and saliva related transmembrane protein